MVRIDCWYCKKNKGNQSCDKYKKIPVEVFNKCEDFIRASNEDFDRFEKEGIETYFYGIDDPDLI